MRGKRPQGGKTGASVNFLTQGLQLALALLARGTDGSEIFRGGRVKERACALAHTLVWGREQREGGVSSVTGAGL